MRLRLENRSGYDTEDLRRFLLAGLRATVPKLRDVDAVVVSSPIRSRGCAEVGGRRIVIAIAPPSRFSLRRLSRLLDHEAAHLTGKEHEDMARELLYSLGPIPDWAKRWYHAGGRLRYKGRAPAQVDRLGATPNARLHNREPVRTLRAVRSRR